MSVLLVPFVLRALVAAVFTGLAAPSVGTYLVQRRQALMGDGIGHVAVTGVAIGLLTSTSPTWTAVATALVAALVIEVVRERGAASGDVALALLFYGGIAGGVMITALAGQSAATLNRYLFGSITTVSPTDLVVTVVLAVVVIVLCLGLAPRLFAVAQDPEFAHTAGLRVRGYNLLVSALAAVTVTVAMRTVGLLLVSALMVVPVATSQQLARTFRGTLLLAMGLGCAASASGVIVATYVNVPPGATIVLLALGGFATAWPLGVYLRRRARALNPLPFPVHDDGFQVPSQHLVAGESHGDEHGHEHGPDCGHVAIPHGDHVDYLHDGHRHAPHGEHYDEH